MAQRPRCAREDGWEIVRAGLDLLSRENARLWLREHPDAFAELSVKMREALGLSRGAAAEAEENGSEPKAAAPSGDRRVRI